MKEVLYTIPVNEGFESGDECPFCFMERDVEQRAIRYVVGPGASYMEPDVREATAREGFCVHHTKALYDYGNTLGSALILQTHLTSVLDDLKYASEHLEMPQKKGLFHKKAVHEDHPYWETITERVNSCYICDKIEYNMQRRYQTFFQLIKDEEFRKKVESCKGFCMRHFARLLQEAETHLPDSQRQWFYTTAYHLMCDNLERVKNDLDWLIAKYDYRNASKPWGNSRDALPRTMEKLEGLHPSDPPFHED